MKKLKLEIDVYIVDEFKDNKDTIARIHYPNEGNKITIVKGLNTVDLDDAIRHEIGHLIDWYISNGNQSDDVIIREQNADIIGEGINQQTRLITTKTNNMNTNKAEEYADNKFTPKAKQYAATSSIKAVYDNCIEDFNAGFNSRQSEIDYLTKEVDATFHELEGYKEHVKQLLEEVEMLRQERSTYLLSFIEWSKAVDEYGNKLDYADVNNFLTTH